MRSMFHFFIFSMFFVSQVGAQSNAYYQIKYGTTFKHETQTIKNLKKDFSYEHARYREDIENLRRSKSYFGENTPHCVSGLTGQPLSALDQITFPITTCHYTTNPLRPREVDKYCACARNEAAKFYEQKKKEELGEANGNRLMERHKINFKLNNEKLSIFEEMSRENVITSMGADEGKTREQFEVFTKGTDKLGDPYAFMNMGAVMSAHEYELNEKDTEALIKNRCDPKKSEAFLQHEIGKVKQDPKYKNYEVPKMTFNLPSSNSMKGMNSLVGKCFTAEEFMEYRSFPDNKMLDILADTPMEEIQKLLDADKTFVSTSTVDDEKKKSIKRFLQGNPLLALYFTAPLNRKDHDSKYASLNNMASLIRGLKEMATAARGMNPKDRIELFRSQNKKMKDFFSDENVKEDLYVGQQVQCEQIQRGQLAELLDQRPKVYNLDTFDALDLAQNGSPDFCNVKTSPIFMGIQNLCMRRANLRCFVKENEEELTKKFKGGEFSNVEASLADKGFYKLTKNITRDIAMEAEEMTSKMCGGFDVTVMNNCSENKYGHATYDECIEDMNTNSDRKIHARQAIRKQLVDFSKQGNFDTDILVLNEMLLEDRRGRRAGKALGKSLASLDSIKANPSTETIARVKDFLKDTPVVAIKGQENLYTQKVKERTSRKDVVLDELGKEFFASTNNSGTKDKVLTAPKAEKVHNPTSLEKAASMMTEIQSNVNQTARGYDGPILPSNFSDMTKEEKTAVITTTKQALNELDNSGVNSAAARQKVVTELEDYVSRDSEAMKSLKDSNNKLQDELISGLKSQIQEMKSQIASMKEDTKVKETAPVETSKVASSGQGGYESGVGYSPSSAQGSTQGATMGGAHFAQQPVFSQTAGGNLSGRSDAMSGKISGSSANGRQAAVNENALQTNGRSPAAIGGLEVIGNNSPMTFNSKAVVFDEAKQRQMPREEIKLESESFNEVRNNESKLKSYLVGLKLGEESIIIISEKQVAGKSSVGSSLQYYVKKDAKGGIQISPVNRAKLEDLNRNILSVKDAG